MEAIELIDKTLASLKDFQRETVNSVIGSFMSGKSQRVLVADEVGLGKTIVAKGVIAELLKAKLQNRIVGQEMAPLRVTYICSNLTLADENRKKLAVFHGPYQHKYVKEPSYRRLLETAIKKDHIQDAGKFLEVCTLTPSTSFNLTRGHGNKDERLIVYSALIRHSDLSQYQVELSEFLSAGVRGWEVKQNYSLQTEIISTFHELLGNKLDENEKAHCGIELNGPTWLEVLSAYCRNEIVFKETETRFRASLRSLLARACAKHLTADLFILDEFQRFKELLDTTEENEESLVARQIFNNKKSKTLLLSATPFKAISRAEDDEDGNAHAEELNYLLKFITNSDQLMLDDYECHRKELQQQILRLRDETFNIKLLDNNHKLAIEKLLKPYLCRTERVQISDGYENLFSSEVPDDLERIKDFSKKEIDVFKALDQLGLSIQKVHSGRSAVQLMEFYKAAPWPLSFLSGYQFKKDLDKYMQDSTVRSALKRSDSAWLSRSDIQSYRISLENSPQAKIRALVRKLFKTASEELLWVPPSLPHYPLRGSYVNQQDFSKTLLFSSWAMVPRALSGLISYEAERRLLSNQKRSDKTYFKESKHSNSIKFDAKSTLIGWSLVYPSKVLCDTPLHFGSITLSEILRQRTAIFKKHLAALQYLEQGQRSGDRWYSLAPMLLDIHAGQNEYLCHWKDGQQRFIAERNEHKGIETQFKLLFEYLDRETGLGPMPVDLAEYLAYLSIAGPAVSVARALRNNWPEESNRSISLAATEVAFAMLAMFNKPEAESILAKRYPQPKYFKAVVKYCVDGGLQAVMDEYVHLLKDAGLSILRDRDSATARLVEVLGFRTSNVACQFKELKHKSSDDTLANADKTNNRHSLRCHYAVPLGNQKMADENSLQRVGSVRDAFNSPFRPFVLNSTSIGQEGLDFHWYCNQLVHWNLPSNPIDIEQREGRVNRYKSLVVRKRLAEGYQHALKFDGSDPWLQLFNEADEQTKRRGRSSDLVPYWHLPEGKARIERFVPMMPLSKDNTKLEHALKVLALYRLAFGQPRQEELLENLLKRDFTEEEIAFITKQLVINLSPMKCVK